MSAAARPPEGGALCPGVPLLDHAAIEARVPHAGAMCLLDGVDAWDAGSIRCHSRRHRPVVDDRPHPLARDGRLPAAAAIEFAAQAMAVHAALLGERDRARPAGARPAPGLLAAVRAVRLERRWIAADADALVVTARRVAGQADQILYDFDVDDGAPLARGRAIVLLER